MDGWIVYGFMQVLDLHFSPSVSPGGGFHVTYLRHLSCKRMLRNVSVLTAHRRRDFLLPKAAGDGSRGEAGRSVGVGPRRKSLARP